MMAAGVRKPPSEETAMGKIAVRQRPEEQVHPANPFQTQKARQDGDSGLPQGLRLPAVFTRPRPVADISRVEIPHCGKPLT